MSHFPEAAFIRLMDQETPMSRFEAVARQIYADDRGPSGFLTTMISWNNLTEPERHVYRLRAMLRSAP